MYELICCCLRNENQAKTEAMSWKKSDDLKTLKRNKEAKPVLIVLVVLMGNSETGQSTGQQKV